MDKILGSLVRYVIFVFLVLLTRSARLSICFSHEEAFILSLSIVRGSKYIIRSDPNFHLYQIKC